MSARRKTNTILVTLSRKRVRVGTDPVNVPLPDTCTSVIVTSVAAANLAASVGRNAWDIEAGTVAPWRRLTLAVPPGKPRFISLALTHGVGHATVDFLAEIAW